MREHPRFFLPDCDLGQSALRLSDEVLHHLRTVLRLSVGARIVLLNGRGDACLARIDQLERRQALATVETRWHETETALPLELIQALPKGDKLDLVLQKGTELGIRCFQPALTQRSVALPDAGRARNRQERWERIVQEAARQSHRGVLPEVKPLAPLAEILARPRQGLKLVLWEDGARPLGEALPETPPAAVTLLIGPEGGLAREEVAAILAAGFLPVHLGPRILRTETAGLAATGILQYLYGDLNRTAPQRAKETP